MANTSSYFARTLPSLSQRTTFPNPSADYLSLFTVDSMASFSSLSSSLSIPISQTRHTKTAHHSINLQFVSQDGSFPRLVHGFFRPGDLERRPGRSVGFVKVLNQREAFLGETADAPILSQSEAIERLTHYQELHKGKQQYLAMYSSIYGGITTDPAAMVIPMDDHMVHRGHGVFDTAAIIDGYLYELDQHLDRIIRSAKMAKIKLPFARETIRKILIQTVRASNCPNGSLRYWLSAGPGDFQLSPSGCPNSSLYAIVIQDDSQADKKGLKVVTSSIPIKPPQFAIVKSVNYLPNVLSKMEAEENGCYAAIWLDQEGYVAEGPNMNVAFVNKEKELLLPRFDKILSGCTARRVLVLAEDLVKEGILKGVRVGDITVEEGKKANEMMLIGSGVLVRPVLQWDDQIIGDGKEGPVTRALLKLIVDDMRSGPHTVRVPVPY